MRAFGTDGSFAVCVFTGLVMDTRARASSHELGDSAEDFAMAPLVGANDCIRQLRPRATDFKVVPQEWFSQSWTLPARVVDDHGMVLATGVIGPTPHPRYFQGHFTNRLFNDENKKLVEIQVPRALVSVTSSGVDKSVTVTHCQFSPKPKFLMHYR